MTDLPIFHFAQCLLLHYLGNAEQAEYYVLNSLTLLAFDATRMHELTCSYIVRISEWLDLSRSNVTRKQISATFSAGLLFPRTQLRHASLQ